MLFSLNITSDRKNLYQQIYESLRKSILEDKLQANEKLPSKRGLADQLKVSTNTVTNAYEQLLAEGYVYTKERKGYYVEDITPFIRKSDLNKQRLPEDLKEEKQDKTGWLSLSHMTSDITMFPIQEWLKCQQKAVTAYKNELSDLGHFQGPYIVRHTIARMISMSRGVICEPEQVIIGAGTELLIRNLMELDAQDTIVGVEDPGYSRFYSLFKNMGLDVCALPIDEKGIKTSESSQFDINYLLVTPSHQFPTGRIMSITRRIELLNWSTQRQDRYIIEDDYDSEYKYETDSIPSLQSLDQNQRVIYTGTFSKTILPGLRISYMVLPPDILRKYQGRYQHMMQSSNILTLYTLHYFIETGAYARHLKRMTHHYEAKRKKLKQQLRQQFADRVMIEDIPAGLHFLAWFYTNKNYKQIEEAARKIKLEVYTMRRFMLENNYNTPSMAGLVLGFAKIQEDRISDAVDRLKQILK